MRNKKNPQSCAEFVTILKAVTGLLSAVTALYLALSNVPNGSAACDVLPAAPTKRISGLP
jgi:succinate-acetate transporter protein